MKQIISFFLAVIFTPIFGGIINALFVRIIFFFDKEPVNNEIPIRILFIDSKLAFIFFLPNVYIFCFYLFFYFFSEATVSFFQPVKIELLLVLAITGGISLICHLVFSQRIKLFEDKAVIEKKIGSKEIDLRQIASIHPKSLFLFPRVKNLVFIMNDKSIIKTKIPEYYFETISSLHKNVLANTAQLGG
ncbi:MAG: hypothetical protein L6Q37_14230 [Bdellovibrionaceae bacterium]|nr:hypothetical protein [Pseudobdellovibrionaceae bacterium]NUM58230.1 hypothetical protein [Pseudobdellovibrionaceae bacterium]